MEFQTITLTVPEHLVSEVYAYVAELTKLANREGEQVSHDPRDLSEEEVRRAYVGGVSDHWRPFLHVLAAAAGEWVAWTTLCASIELSPRQASGMLGAAERRCQQRPPYEKTYEEGEHWFRMPAETAKVVNRLAAIGRRANKLSAE